MSNYSIRSYQSSDCDAVLRITVESFEPVSIERNVEAMFGTISGRDWMWRKARQVAKELDREPHGAFVAVIADNVIGYITTTADREAGIGFIPNLAVAAAHRGAGIGRALIDRALDHFREQGLVHARIETLEQNPIGQQLYPECGFREVARQIYFARNLAGPGDGES